MNKNQLKSYIESFCSLLRIDPDEEQPLPGKPAGPTASRPAPAVKARLDDERRLLRTLVASGSITPKQFGVGIGRCLIAELKTEKLNQRGYLHPRDHVI